MVISVLPHNPQGGAGLTAPAVHKDKDNNMRRYSNIDLMQLSVGSDGNIYLPNSISFAGERVDTILFYAPETAGKSPLDRAPLVQRADLPGFFINLYNDSKKVLVKDLNCGLLDMHHPQSIGLHDVLDLDISGITYAGQPTARVSAGMALLAYVSYGEREEADAELPANCTTVTVPQDSCHDTPAPLSNFIDDYFVHSGKKVYAIASNRVDFFLDLRLDSGRRFKWLPSLIFQSGAPIGKPCPFFCDAYDIDFRNSSIVNFNTDRTEPIKITLYYK